MAATVEVLVCRRAMIFAREINIFDIVVEGDAETIIKAILAADDSHPEYGIVISDVVALGF